MSTLTLSSFKIFLGQIADSTVHYWKYSRKFPVAKQKRFLITFERLLNSLNPVKAIFLMREVATGVELEVLNDINESLQRGGKISDGFENWFGDFVVQGLRLGEENNSLKQAVRAAIDNMSLSGLEIFSPFSKAVYPIVLTFSGLSLSSYLGSRLLPLISKKLAKYNEIPFEITVFKALTYFNDHILSYLLIAFFSIIVGLVFYFKNGVGERRDKLDSYFPFYEYRQIKSIFFMRMFSMLKKYKMADLAILSSIAKREKDLYMLHHTNKMINGIKDGLVIGKAIDTGLINKADILTLKVLSESQEGMFVDAMEGTIEGTVEAIKLRFEIIANVLKYVFMTIGFIILADMGTVIFSIDKYVK